MHRICLAAAAVAVFASSAAHAGPSRGLIIPSGAAPPAMQPAPAVAQGAPQPAPAAAPGMAPATTIFQTTNPQAQKVVKELQSHGLIPTQPASQPAPASSSAANSSANVVTLPAPNPPASSQPAQVGTVPPLPVQVQQPVQAPAVQAPPVQTQTLQTQVVSQPSTTASQPQVVQTQARQTSAIAAAKPVTRARYENCEARLRRVAARFGLHW